MLLILSLTVITILSSFTFYPFLVQIAFAQPYASDAMLNIEPAIEG